MTWRYTYFFNFILLLKAASLRLLCCALILLRHIITFSGCDIMLWWEDPLETLVIVLNSIISRVDLSQSRTAILWWLWGNGGPEQCKHTVVIVWQTREFEQKEVRHSSSRFYLCSVLAKFWVTSMKNTNITTERWSRWENHAQQCFESSFGHSKIILQFKSWETDFGSNFHGKVFY